MAQLCKQVFFGNSLGSRKLRDWKAPTIPKSCLRRFRLEVSKKIKRSGVMFRLPPRRGVRLTCAEEERTARQRINPVKRNETQEYIHAVNFPAGGSFDGGNLYLMCGADHCLSVCSSLASLPPHWSPSVSGEKGFSIESTSRFNDS